MKKIKLSQRMQALCALLKKADRVADIGCDHAHVSIYLIQENIARHVIAMDIGKGPLQRAKENICEYGLASCIETRLSNGAQRLQQGEVEACIIAGMGGMLMKGILSDGLMLFKDMKQLVLQPQSDLKDFRYFLSENGFWIEDEDFVYEDGKFYPMMRVVPRTQNYSLTEAEALYGPCLIKNKNKVLKDFLKYEYKQKEEILLRLENNSDSGERTAMRIETIKQELLLNKGCMDEM